MEISEELNSQEQRSENLFNNDDDNLLEEITNQKIERRKIEKEKLLNQVASGQIHSTKERVAHILNLYSETRNSDIDLAWEYWRIFESKNFNGNHIDREQLRALTKITSLSRMRAKIQNEYDLYLADEDVRKFRGVLKDDIKQTAISDKPSRLKPYYVYIDETGKNQNYLSVGSVWIPDIGESYIELTAEIQKWKVDNLANYEFHFSAFNDKNKFNNYKNFYLKFFSLFPTVGYKVIVIKNSGFRDQNLPLTDLTYHLIAKGVDHENRSGRAPLPRRFQIYLDNENQGSDILKIENIRERLNSQNIEGFHLESFEAVSSENNFFIQMTDLITGAVNRKLNTPSGNGYKDELANFILEAIGLNITLVDAHNNVADNAEVFDLTSTLK